MLGTSSVESKLTSAGLCVGTLTPRRSLVQATSLRPGSSAIEHPIANREVAGECPARVTFFLSES